MLGEILNSELNPAMIVSGLDEAEMEALYGEIEALPRQKRTQAIRKIATGSAKNTIKARGTSREEFEKRLHLLDPSLKQQVITGAMRLADTCYYVTKDISAKTIIKMFRDDDNKAVGVTNVSAGKLEKGNVFLLNAISVLSGIIPGGGNQFGIDYDLLPAYLRNGEFYFKANGSEIIPLASMEIFNSKNIYNQPVGMFKLDNPVLVHTQQAMEFQAEWGVAGIANTWMKVMLHGTVSYKR